MFPRDMDSLVRSLFAPFGIRSHDISTIDFFLGAHETGILGAVGWITALFVYIYFLANTIWETVNIDWPGSLAGLRVMCFVVSYWHWYGIAT
jgi:hypothetical protein